MRPLQTGVFFVTAGIFNRGDAEAAQPLYINVAAAPQRYAEKKQENFL